MSELERPERYMLADSSMVMVPADVAAWLVRQAELRKWRTNSIGNSRHHAVLMAITLVGQTHVERVCGSSGSAARKPAEIAPVSEWMNTTQVADAVNLTDRRVRQEIEAGRLGAEKHGRSWRIHRAEMKRYRAARAS